MRSRVRRTLRDRFIAETFDASAVNVSNASVDPGAITPKELASGTQQSAWRSSDRRVPPGSGNAPIINGCFSLLP
jgi:hypothetical protein